MSLVLHCAMRFCLLCNSECAISGSTRCASFKIRRKDWDSESIKMAEIYRNSLFTIVASSSQSGMEGIIPNMAERQNPLLINLKGQQGGLYIDSVPLSWELCVEDDALSKHGLGPSATSPVMSNNISLAVSRYFGSARRIERLSTNMLTFSTMRTSYVIQNRFSARSRRDPIFILSLHTTSHMSKGRIIKFGTK